MQEFPELSYSHRKNECRYAHEEIPSDATHQMDEKIATLKWV